MGVRPRAGTGKVMTALALQASAPQGPRHGLCGAHRVLSTADFSQMYFPWLEKEAPSLPAPHETPTIFPRLKPGLNPLQFLNHGQGSTTLMKMAFGLTASSL